MKNVDLNYKPRFDSFPFRVIKLLFYLGKLKNINIRIGTGIDLLNQNSDWDDHGEYYFNNCLIPRLLKKGVIRRTSRGYYDLTPEWKQHYFKTLYT